MLWLGFMDKKKQEELSGKRTMLADVVPLDVPMAIQIGVTNACNLQCEFCEHSSDKFKKVKKENLDCRLVEKFVYNIKENGKKINQILLSGIGEPLVNRQIVDMVKIISESKITDRIGIISNGTLLDRHLSDSLIDAGLNVLRISLNGLSREDYRKYTGVAIDFERFYENLNYFFQKACETRKEENRDIKVYIKIMDYMLEDTKDKKNIFMEKFAPICDILNIEHLNIASPDIDYNKFGNRDYERSRRGTDHEKGEICPRVFYEGIISHEGQVLACCHDFWFSPNQLVMGDLRKENFLNIWNGKKFQELRLRILKGDLQGTICENCTEYKGLMSKEDNIDSRREELICYYNK